MKFKTRFTELMGIDYPICQGGMQWVGRAELASAVSNAGALGMLTALTEPTPEALGKEIERCRSMTDKPFGVNLTILPTINAPPYDEYRRVIIESGVKIVETAGHNPQEHVDELKAAGIKLIHKCTSVRHALTAERKGVDVISIDGYECAGHPGEDDVGGLVLTPVTVDAIKVPVITSGGIGDGRGLAAALALGAEGVNMGSRFVITKESPVHDNIKQLGLDNDERGTNLILRKFHNTGRCAKNSVSDEVVKISARPDAKFEDIAHLVRGIHGRGALETGDIDSGLVWLGQVQGLIHDIPTVAEVIERIVNEAREIINQRLARIVG